MMLLASVLQQGTNNVGLCKDDKNTSSFGLNLHDKHKKNILMEGHLFIYHKHKNMAQNQRKAFKFSFIIPSSLLLSFTVSVNLSFHCKILLHYCHVLQSAAK